MKSTTRGPRIGRLSAAVLSACGGSAALLFASHAHAQQPAASEQIEQVTVTGTRIQRASGFTTPVPITAVTPEELTAFQPSTTLADQLDKLPQFFATQSAQRGGGALFGSAGGSYIDMRAMGPQRTLVLLDGARVVPADRGSTVNVDNFPTALLQSVEVVTGGASAAYGADALAGVTNFVLNRRYQGFDANIRVGQTDFGDGDNYKATFAGGTDVGDKWHVIGSLELQNIDQIQRDPTKLGDWFRRYGFVTNPAWTGPTDTTHPARLVKPDVYSAVHTPTGKITSGFNAAGQAVPFTLAGQTFNYDGSAVRPFAAGTTPANAFTGTQAGGPEAEIANEAFPGGPVGAEVERRNVFGGFTWDVTDDTQFFGNLLLGRTESNRHDVRGIPHGTAPWQLTVFRENPYLPEDVRQAMFAQGVSSFRLDKQGTVLGQSGNYDDHEEARNRFDQWALTLGMNKDLTDNWKLTARVQRGATRKYTAVLNEVRVDREFLAMDAVEIDPVTRQIIGDDPGEVHGTGVIVCNVQRVGPLPSQLAAAVTGVRVPAPQGDDSLGGPEDRVPIPGPIGPDSIQNCVPMNVLGQGNVSPAAQQYVLSPKWGDSVVTQDFAEALLTGDIWKGFGPGAFSMAGGMTYRQQKFWQRGQPQTLMAYGPPLNAPALGIRGIPSGFTGGSPNLHEFSTVPAINGGYDVWEAFTEFNLPLWQRDGGPQRFELDLAGRYSDYSTSGGIVSNKAGINFQVAAPLRLRATMSRDVREPTFSERFDLQGGGGRVNDPTRGGASFEITVTTGGNPNLEPEKADTVTAGIVYSPQQVQGLQVSVDAYRIDLTGAVGSLGQQRIVDECAAGNANLCSLVFRDAAGVIATVKNVYLNLDRAKVRGLDFELLFNTEPDFAKRRAENLSFRFLAGRLLEDSTTPLNGTKLDYSGAYNATVGATEPDFRALASARYQIGKFGVDLQQRYMSEVMLNPMWVEGRDVDDNTIQSKMYTDLSLTFDGDTARGKNWRASLTVTNLFDADPPVIADFGQRFSTQSVSAGNYDYYGRLYSLAFDYKF